MANKIVVFDCDGVLFDFNKGFAALIRHEFGVDLAYQDGDQPTWDSYNYPMTPGETSEAWRSISESFDFWANLTPLVSSEVFKTINSMLNAYFVTNRPGISAKPQTEFALRRAGIVIPTVLIASKKGEVCRALGATHCIDDKLGNALAVSWLSPETKSFILDRPYNRVDPELVGGKIIRVSSVEEFLDYVDRD